MSWTDERIDQLKRMWLEGSSASQIAAELANDITRNAVIGKAHRLGLTGRVKTAAPTLSHPKKVKQTTPPNNSPKKAPEDTTAPSSMPPLSIAVPTQEIAIPFSNIVSAIASYEPVTIDNLHKNMCRWPLDNQPTHEFRYCGAKIAVRTTYCPAHALRAYQPTNRPSKNPGTDKPRLPPLAIR